MTKKQVTRSKVQSTPLVARMDGGVQKTQRDAGALRSQARGDAVRLSDEVQRLRNDFETCVEQTSKNLEAARQEIQRLSRRMQHLEQLVKQHRHADTPAVSLQAPPSRAKSLFTFLGRPSLPSLS